MASADNSTLLGADEQAARALTIEVAAQALRLPAALLYRLNVQDHPRGGLVIPYRDADGRETSRVHRRSLADLAQATGQAPPSSYGLDRLERACRQGRLILVANEIDCWTLWWYDIAALGLPGAAGLLTADCVEGLAGLYVHQGPGESGAAFVAAVLQRLSALGFKGSVHELRLPFEVLGPTALQVRDPGQCRALLHARLSAAPPLALPPTASLSPSATQAVSGPATGQDEAHAAPALMVACEEGHTGGPATPASPSATARPAAYAEGDGPPPPAAAPAAAPPPVVVRWLSPGRIPLGQVTMLDGDPGLGKSCVALDVAARLTRGQAMPFADAGTALPAADAVILSAEDTRAVVLSRVAAAGGDCGRVHVVRPSLDDLLGARPQSPTEERMLLPRDLGRLRDLLDRTAARLLIIDPLVAFLDRSVQWHMEQSIRRVLLALAQIAEELGVAIVLIRHLNKQSSLKVIYRGSGSIALIGNARAGLLVVEDPDHPDERLLVSQKSNLCPTPLAARYVLRSAGDSVRIAWLDEHRLDTSALRSAPALPEESHAIAEATAFLKENLRHGAVPANHLIREAKLAGISERTLRRAKFKLGVISRVWPYGTREGERWSWELPKPNEAPQPPG